MSSLVSEVKIPAEALLPISISMQPKFCQKAKKKNLQHSYRKLKMDQGLLSLFSRKKLFFFLLVFDEITKIVLFHLGIPIFTDKSVSERKLIFVAIGNVSRLWREKFSKIIIKCTLIKTNELIYQSFIT